MPKRKGESFLLGVLRSLQFSSAIPSNSLILVGKGGHSLPGHQLCGNRSRSKSHWPFHKVHVYPCYEVAAEWAYTVSWPLDLENSIWRKHGDLFWTFFFNRGCHWEECGNLSVFQGRRERLLYWLEGGKIYVSVRLPSHQQWWYYRDSLFPSLSFLSPALCATPELVAHLPPLVHQLLLASSLWHSN